MMLKTPPPDSPAVRVTFVMMLVMAAGLLMSLPLAISYHHRSVVGALCTLMVFGCIPLWLYQGKIRAMLRFRGQRSAQRAALARRLAEAGLSEAHPGDRRRVELEQRFWQEMQREAVESLRLRFGEDPKDPDLVGVLLTRSLFSIKRLVLILIGRGDTSIKNLASFLFFCASMILISSLIFSRFLHVSYEKDFIYGDGSISSLVMFIIVCIAEIIFIIFVWFVLTLQTLHGELERVEEHREFVYARQHVAELVELSGGITMVDGAASGGELTQAEPPA